MQNKGYTLLEMLVVLSIISMFTLLFSFSYHSLHKNLTYITQTIYERILQAQSSAMMQKKTVFVDFQGNLLTIDGKKYPLEANCTKHQFHFNASGHVSRALTITCHLDDQQQSIVVQLGSGRMYVR